MKIIKEHIRNGTIVVLSSIWLATLPQEELEHIDIPIYYITHPQRDGLTPNITDVFGVAGLDADGNYKPPVVSIEPMSERLEREFTFQTRIGNTRLVLCNF